MTQVKLGETAIGNNCPMVLLGGVNVLEDEAFALRCALPPGLQPSRYPSGVQGLL